MTESTWRVAHQPACTHTLDCTRFVRSSLVVCVFVFEFKWTGSHDYGGRWRIVFLYFVRIYTQKSFWTWESGASGNCELVHSFSSRKKWPTVNHVVRSSLDWPFPICWSSLSSACASHRLPPLKRRYSFSIESCKFYNCRNRMVLCQFVSSNRWNQINRLSRFIFQPDSCCLVFVYGWQLLPYRNTVRT